MQTRVPRKPALIPVTSVLMAVALGQAPNAGKAFEVASVRLSNDLTRRPSLGAAANGERFIARNIPLVWLISSAYGVSTQQISGLPRSFNFKNYDIEAKAAERTTREAMMQMLQKLIEDRFNLRLRRETRTVSMYVLTVARNGPKLDENKDGLELEARNSGAGREMYRNFSMPIFANILAAHVDDIVVDRTGLMGSYDFKLSFTPERIG